MRRRIRKNFDKNNSLPPIPTSCTEAKKLLNEKAHVNLVDYFAARKALPVPGQEKDYAKLLFRSREAVVRYTIKTKKFVPRGDAKNEWLQPLLRTMASR